MLPPSITADDLKSSSADLMNYRLFMNRCSASRLTLSNSFNDAWISGHQSIVLGNDPEYRVPLWSERVLAGLHQCSLRAKRWQDICTWLANHESNNKTEVFECRSSLNLIPSLGTIDGFSRAVQLSWSELGIFLSDEWISDEIINAASEYILRQLGPHSRKRIANCFLVQHLVNAKTLNEVYIPNRRNPSVLDSMIAAGEVDVIYIPLHVNGDHWTLLEVNIPERTIAYGNSLDRGASPPYDQVETIKWWIDSLSPSLRSFTLTSLSSPFPTQLDFFSCGIIVISYLAHILLAYEPWTQVTRERERMRWFIRLKEKAFLNVRTRLLTRLLILIYALG
jgi:hypothetical protein